MAARLQRALCGADKGSTFRIELPSWRSKSRRRFRRRWRRECEGMTVLLVEDNIDTLRVLGRLLGRLAAR